MTNPARELLEVLASWNKDGPSQTVYALRGISPDAAGGWRALRHAMRLLDDVHVSIDELEKTTNVEKWRRHQPAWAKALVLPDEMWVHGSGPIIKQDAYDALEFLDQYLEISSPKIAAEARDSILATVEAALQGLDSLDLNDKEVAYIRVLLVGIEEALKEARTTGSIQLHKHLDEASGALLRLGALLTHDGEKEKGQTFAKLAVALSVARAGLYDVAALAAIGSLGLDSVLAITAE